MSGSSGGTTTQIQKSDPWAGQQPFLQNSMGGETVPGLGNTPVLGSSLAVGVLPAASSIYQQYSPQFFPGSTVAGFNPQQQAGQAAEFNYGASGGSPAVGAATNFETNLANGAYLDPTKNPNWQSMASNVMSNVVPGLESQFTQGNQMNSPGAAFAVSQGATNALGSLAAQQYGNTLNTMNSGAAYAAPNLQQSNLASIAAMQDAGNQQQAQSQNELNSQIQRFNYNQTLPMNLLDWYSGIVNGTGGNGGTSSLSTPYFGPSPTTGALTGALGGAATGASLGGPYAPYTAAAGAIIGGLGGYFGNGG